MIEIGTNAPNFSLHNAKKELVALEGMRGKTVVLAFFPAAFTGVCSKEMCTFRDSLAALNSLDATVVGIAPDAPFSLGAFAEKNELNFPLLSDFSRETIRAYGVTLENFAGLAGYTTAQRSIVVVDKGGKVSWTWMAPNPGVEPDYAAVKSAVEAAR